MINYCVSIWWGVKADPDFESLLSAVDTRDSDFGVAEQWSGGEILGQRATFRADRHPAALILTNVKAKDEALYRCRVDFRLAQTRNAHVNLTVIGKNYSTPCRHPIFLPYFLPRNPRSREMTTLLLCSV
ncbi:hypothetical protein OUZ56_013940 [Daphnia magna]|uniref:Ig-like domain-containing protein n=1 Tax=Daphnia magna TaxID=35525 RepID=A0ABQ9Z7D5_9CRUS|nr:hypothetical protein OUZ56_013940 [Daphnia magna]